MGAWQGSRASLLQEMELRRKLDGVLRPWLDGMYDRGVTPGPEWFDSWADHLALLAGKCTIALLPKADSLVRVFSW